MQAGKPPARRIAIVGAGPGGLSALIALSQAGFDVRPFERQPEIKAMGGAVLLNLPVMCILRGFGDRPLLKQWSHGRVAAMGDAAHPTSPYGGYGFGMAIEDGYFLGRFLRGVDLADRAALAAALPRYEAQRVDYPPTP